MATRRFPALARQAVALSFAAALLVGQAVFFDSWTSAAKCADADSFCKLVESGKVRF